MSQTREAQDAIASRYAQMGSKDIECLPVNTKGHDFVAADLHGNIGCLKEILKKVDFAKGDRLFLAGDLADRDDPKRPGSAEIVKLLASLPNCYAIKGNHEALALST